MKLEGKVALITGSSRGIGRATALLFAQEGAKVVVNYNESKKQAEEVVQQIKKIGSVAIAVQADVADETQVKKMFEATVKEFGRLDILVNNAGMVIDTPVMERTVEQFKRTVDVNLLGTFLFSRLAAQEMLKHDGGSIVNIASSNGIDSFSPEAIDYDATKAGIIKMTKDLAAEFAPKIRVNAIAPGWVDTEMNKNLPKDFIKDQLERIWLNRFAKPEEIAKVILFLASEDASFVNGSTLKVDGGYGAI